MPSSLAPLQILLAASPVSENATHQLGTDGEEVGAVRPAYFLESDQPKVNLID
jgi:hypothetical protein